MSTTETDSTEDARLAALTKGPGYEASRLAAAEAEQQAAHQEWLAQGGAAGEKARAAAAAEDSRAVVRHQAGMLAMATSYEADRSRPLGYANESEHLEQGIADPDVGAEELFARFESFVIAMAVTLEVQTHALRGVVTAKGGAPGPYHGQQPLPEFAEVQQRAFTARAANAAAAKVGAMHTRAQTAYGTAAK